MAEITDFRNNALPYPVYNAPWTVVFTLLDTGGEPVTGATCDSEISKNGDTAVDCVNEGAEIPFTTVANKGMYYLTLTATEMVADIVAITVNSATSLPTVIVLYPRKLVSIHAGTAQAGNSQEITLAAGASSVDDKYNGCMIGVEIDGVNESRIIQDYNGTTKVADVYPDWGTGNPDSDDGYDIFLPEGMQMPEADVIAISGNATAADNCQSMYDGTGYAGGTIVLQSDITKIHGTAITETAGQLAGAFTKFFDVAAPTATCLSLPDAVPGAAGGNFIAGTNAQTTITTSLIVGAITLTTPIESDLTSIHGSALTETAGQLAAGFKKVFDVATPVFTAESVNQSANNNTILANATYGLSAIRTRGDIAWITGVVGAANDVTFTDSTVSIS